MGNRDEQTRKVIDQMTKEYVETGKKGGIAIVNEERVRRHVEGVVERTEKKKERGEYGGRK